MDLLADFVEEATTGQFDRPARGGWTAEQIVAHVARTNEELIAVTEVVLAGDQASYDNRGTTDAAVLDAYAASYGGLRGLADRVAETVAVLRDLTGQLGARGDTLVPSRNQEGDEVPADGPVRWATMLETNADRHTGKHLDQLRALRRR
jgi:Mycothiol maleylpyruvate isomerase N-terminal domain